MKKVFVQGLGFVGSAMATATAIARDLNGDLLYDVIGIDLPNNIGSERVRSINDGEFPFPTSDKNLISAISEATKNGNLKASIDQNKYSEADIIIVDIPLDIDYLNEEAQLNFKSFESAISTLGQQISLNTLLVIETTVPPGTCEKIIIPILRRELQKREMSLNDILLSHSYERVMPGDNYLASIIDNWRVFSGFNKESADACEEFLSSIINVENFPLTRLSSLTESETSKVMENTYRAVNIAFIDEWTKFGEKIGVDLFNITEAIRVRPSHANIRYPGLGVGGYCLTKDPTFAPAAAAQLFGENLSFPLSKMAVKINDEMPLHTFNRLLPFLDNSLTDKNILVCGVSYRQDIGDTRYSPSEKLVRQLLDQGAKVTCHDPYIEFWEEMNQDLPKQLPPGNKYDAIIMAVPHKHYKMLDIPQWADGCGIILDANMVLSYDQRKIARESGIRVESIGRADGL
tara:strand:- start:640 stop:2019 length:1380 start_codon:yes stop_codon:yes gene_type:complete